MNPLIADILKQHYPHGRWPQKPPECPVPRQDELDDSQAHFSRPDAGSSLPGSCVHDFFAIAGGKFKCKWCGEKV